MMRLYTKFILCLVLFFVASHAVAGSDKKPTDDNDTEVTAEIAVPDLGRALRELPIRASIFKGKTLSEFHKNCEVNYCALCHTNDAYAQQIHAHECDKGKCEICVYNKKIQRKIVEHPESSACREERCGVCLQNAEYEPKLVDHICLPEGCDLCDGNEKLENKIFPHACEEVNCPECEADFTAVNYEPLDDYTRCQLASVSKSFHKIFSEKHDGFVDRVTRISLPKIAVNSKLLERFQAVSIDRFTGQDLDERKKHQHFKLNSNFLNKTKLSHIKYMEADVATYEAAKIIAKKTHKNAELHLTVEEVLSEDSMAPLLADLELEDLPLLQFTSLTLQTDSAARALGFLRKIKNKIGHQNCPVLFLSIDDDMPDFEVDITTLQVYDTDFYNLMLIQDEFEGRVHLASRDDLYRSTHHLQDRTTRAGLTRVHALKSFFQANSINMGRNALIACLAPYQPSTLRKLAELRLSRLTNDQRRQAILTGLLELPDKKREEILDIIVAHPLNQNDRYAFFFEGLKYFNHEDYGEVSPCLLKILNSIGGHWNDPVKSSFSNILNHLKQFPRARRAALLTELCEWSDEHCFFYAGEMLDRFFRECDLLRDLPYDTRRFVLDKMKIYTLSGLENLIEQTTAKNIKEVAEAMEALYRFEKCSNYNCCNENTFEHLTRKRLEIILWCPEGKRVLFAKDLAEFHAERSQKCFQPELSFCKEFNLLKHLHPDTVVIVRGALNDYFPEKENKYQKTPKDITNYIKILVDKTTDRNIEEVTKALCCLYPEGVVDNWNYIIESEQEFAAKLDIILSLAQGQRVALAVGIVKHAKDSVFTFDEHLQLGIALPDIPSDTRVEVYRHLHKYVKKEYNYTSKKTTVDLRKLRLFVDRVPAEDLTEVAEAVGLLYTDPGYFTRRLSDYGDRREKEITVRQLLKRVQLVSGWPKGKRVRFAKHYAKKLKDIRLNSVLIYCTEHVHSSDISSVLARFVKADEAKYREGLFIRKLNDIILHAAAARFCKKNPNFAEFQVVDAIRNLTANRITGDRGDLLGYRVLSDVYLEKIPEKYKTSIDLTKFFKTHVIIYVYQKALKDKGYDVDSNDILGALKKAPYLQKYKVVITQFKKATLDSSKDPVEALCDFANALAEKKRNIIAGPQHQAASSTSSRRCSSVRGKGGRE